MADEFFRKCRASPRLIELIIYQSPTTGEDDNMSALASKNDMAAQASSTGAKCGSKGFEIWPRNV
jgi:hypothetical protein